MTSIIPETDGLLARAAQGDREAGERLLTNHRDLLRKMVAARLDRRLAARVDPSDVVQEALAAAALALPKYLRERPIPFVAWLRQFAWERLVKLHRHHLRAQRRSVSREEYLAPDLPDDSVQQLGRRLAASGASPSEDMIRSELREQVREALSRLNAPDREILIMRYVERLPLAQVAAALNIKEGAAKVRHLRALRRLQELLERLQS